MSKAEIKADALVIGAGVVGAAAAYELARRGVEVVVLDAGPGVGNGCSYANAGLLAPEHVEPLTTPANVRMGATHLFRRDSPFHISPSARIAPWLLRFMLASRPRRTRELTTIMRSLAWRSLTMHSDYARAGLQTGFRQNGSMDVFLTQERFASAERQLAAHPHVGVRALTASQANHIEPGLGQVAGAILHEHDATCETQAFARECLRAAADLGARVYWNAHIHQLTGAGPRVTGAQTNLGVVTAGAVVVAAGLGSRRLTSRFGIRLPLLGGKGYVVDVPAQAQPAVPLTFKELKVVATPYDDRLRLCGTMDLGDTNDRIRPSRVTAIQHAAARALPTIDTTRPIQVWAGQRPCTADGIPVIGPSSQTPNLHIATGHGMWGLVLAPVTAVATAQAVTAGPTDPTLSEFSPDRFTTSTPRTRAA